MPCLTVPTQFGRLTLWENEGAIVRLTWDGDAHDDTAILRRAAQQVRAYDAGELEEFDLPLRVEGSDFQRAVCDQMSSIADQHVAAIPFRLSYRAIASWGPKG